MASNRDLFGDDSASDEDEVNQNGEVSPEKPKDDGEKIAIEKSEEPPTEHKEESGHGDLDDSDEDDDEPQFDDQGAIVGLKSTTLAGAKINRENPDLSSRRSESPSSVQDAAVSTKSLVLQEMKTRPNNLHMTKLPNILGVQTEAFDPTTYLAAAEEEDFGQAAYNLMRWRYQTDAAGHSVRDANDQLVRESNTRLVEWEDGTYTLHVGNETFQVDMLDSSSAGFAGLNGYLYLSQTATYKDEADEQKEEPAGTVLECMGPVQSRMVIRPSSLQSEAHKLLTVGIRQKTIKKARIAEFVTQEDPEKLKLERIKVKQDLEKAAIRKKSGGSYNPRSSTGGRRPRMSREYLEDEEDGNFDTTNLKAMKRRTMGGEYEEMDDYGDGSDDYGDADDDKDETFRKVRPGRGGQGKKTGSKDAESDEDEVFFGEVDDDEDEITPVVKASKKRSHQAVVDDDSE